MKEKRITTYGKYAVIRESIQKEDGTVVIKSKGYKGTITDRYDNIKTRFLGKKIETDEFLRTIVLDGFEKKDRYMMVYRDYEEFRACTSERTLLYYKEWASHFVPNGFYKWNDRSNENLRHLRWLVFDFELLKSNGERFTPHEVFNIFYESGLQPTFISRSKTNGCYHVYVAHGEMTGHTRSIYLHNKIQKYYVSKIGCDEGAIGASQGFRIPKYVYFYGLHIHDVDELKKEVATEVNRKAQEDTRQGQVLSFKEAQIWNDEAIKALMECEFVGSRNHAAFTIALLYYALGKPKEECAEFLWEWYQTARTLRPQPFYPSEIRKTLKSAFSGKYRGPKREYIEAITGIDFPYNIYGSRKRKVDPRTGEYRKLKNENTQAIVEFLRGHGGQVTMFQKDIIAELKSKGFSERSLKRHFKQLKDKGIITYNVSKGEHAKIPTYTLLDSEFKAFQTRIEFDRTIRSQNHYLGVLQKQNKNA